MADPHLPARIAAAGPDGAEYALAPGLYAVRGAAGAAGAEPVAEVGEMRIYRGEPGGADAAPVYTLSGGTPAVPTGRAFVRFAEGADPRAAEDALREAGFRIESVPSYAPHAAWLAPADGSVAAGLRGVEALRRIAGVEHAEPEMLVPRGRRG